MRQVTVTEKYRAVLEGNMAKGEFVRQMRLAHPQHITQFNGFDDSVQILKNRGLLFEIKKEEVVVEEIKEEAAALPYNDEAFQRGIRYELNAKGIEVHAGSNIKLEDYDSAKDIAHKNLYKDPMHYLNLISGESSNVDKHDKPVETKRGAKDVDTFNGMKKADLKENKKELAKLLKEGKLEDLADRLGVPVEKLKGAADKIKDMERQSAEKDALKLAKMKEVIDEEEEEMEEGKGHMVDEHEYEFFSLIFDKKYNDILEDYLSSDSFKQDEKELQGKTGQANVFDYAYKDQWENYIREFESINRDDLGENEAEVQREMASSNLELKSLAKKLFLRFKNMGANVELTTDKVTLDKAPRGDSDLKNVWIQVNDDGISLSLVGDKAISFNDKIQNDFSNFEFIQRQDSKTWNGQDVKNLTILPGKGMSEGYGKNYEEDGIKKEEMSSKMKKSDLKAKIKEDIISLLQEDEIEYETPLEEKEEVEIDIEDEVEIEEPKLNASVAQTGLSDDEKEIQDALKLAYDNAQSIGDEKLADQIGNSITFFTRTHVVER